MGEAVVRMGEGARALGLAEPRGPRRNQGLEGLAGTRGSTRRTGGLNNAAPMVGKPTSFEFCGPGLGAYASLALVNDVRNMPAPLGRRGRSHVMGAGTASTISLAWLRHAGESY